MAASEPEIDALVRLLDDPDDGVQERVRARLDELGRDALPELRRVREQAAPEVRDRIDAIVHDLHFSDVVTAWQAVMARDPVDLERGAFLLALYRYPMLDIEAYRERLDNIADSVRPAVEDESGAERARALAEALAEDLGFDGNRDQYDDPGNWYLNRILDRRTGSPIGLSVVYVLVARRLDLPMCGLDLPGHFLVRYASKGQELLLDPFNGGEVVSRETCVRALLDGGQRPNPQVFECAGNRAILHRHVRTLQQLAEESGQTDTADELERLAGPAQPVSEDGSDGARPS